MVILRLLFKRRRTSHLASTLLAALIAPALVIGILAATGALSRLDGKSIDHRFENRGNLAKPNGVVIVGIDKQTETYFNTWPLSRSLYAQAVTKLKKAGAKVIVLDVPFDDKSAQGLRAQTNAAMASIPDWQRSANTQPIEYFDDQFIDALKENGPIVVESYRHGSKTTKALSGVRSIDHPDPVKESKATVGLVIQSTGADGTTRSYTFSDKSDKPSPALLARELTQDQRNKANQLPHEEELLNWHGGISAFEQASFGDVALGLTLTRSFRDKVVFIGRTDGISRDDIKTPFGTQPEVVAQATAYVNLRDHSWIRELPPMATLALLVGLALLTWLLLEVVALPFAIATCAALVYGLTLLSESAFADGVVIPFVLSFTTLLSTFAGVAIALVTISVRERLRIKSLFARYVSPDVVNELLDSDDTIRLGGTQREISVLFSDIRGFTTMSENVDPEDMVEQLNEYFVEMVQVVTSKRGTLDKFLGDGLMAIFGAPTDQDDHAQRACEAALEMQSRLGGLNRRRERAGREPLAIGIGIHTGKAVVGNVGSPLFRVDFTAIGDTVNLAARLEGLTKELDAPIVVSASTAAACPGMHFTERGSVVVKGRTEATSVFELRADQTTRRQPSAGVVSH